LDQESATIPEGAQARPVVHRLCQEFELAPLTEAQWGVSRGPLVRRERAAGPVRVLHRHSEGNPLFMLAALDHMTKRALICGENGSSLLHVPLAQIELPCPMICAG